MIITKQSVGIDIAKLSFTVCICKRKYDGSISFTIVAKFSNNKTGFNQFLKWVKKHQEKSLEISFVMEATGIYHEQLAYHLHNLKKLVSVVLPNKVSHYAKSLNAKTKTDPEDARIISQLGAERQLALWAAPSPLYRKLRALSRLHKSLQEDKIVAINRLKQIKCSYDPLKLAIKTHETTKKIIEKQLKIIDSKMENLLKSDKEIWAKVQNVLTIKGIGIKTIAIILAETQGFKLIQNQRQLVSYSGLDVSSRESGTSVKGKSRISKKGNSHIRAALYFPALVASNHNTYFNEIYHRIIKNKSSKMVGIVAIQRRLLVLMYSLWKNNMPYVENYNIEGISGCQSDEASSLSSTQRVDLTEKYKVGDDKVSSPTQNEHLYDQTSEALLCL